MLPAFTCYATLEVCSHPFWHWRGFRTESGGMGASIPPNSVEVLKTESASLPRSADPSEPPSRRTRLWPSTRTGEPLRPRKLGVIHCQQDGGTDRVLPPTSNRA